MPKKKPVAVEAVTPAGGYRRPPRYREFMFREYPGLEAGDTPLMVKVPVNLSFDEQAVITEHSTGGTTYEEMFPYIAPYVVEWNVVRVAHETGQPEAVPPPAVAGWEVLRTLDHVEAHWVLDKVKFGYLALIEDANAIADAVTKARAESQKKSSAGSEPTPGTTPGANSGNEA